jgi:hypothetical protein
MQKKSKPDRYQEVDLDIVLVNCILGRTKPVLDKFAEAGYSYHKSDENVPELWSLSDVQKREFSDKLEALFRIIEDGKKGWSLPIGALRDDDEAYASVHQDTITVKIPRELFQLVRSIVMVLEDAGLYVTNSEVIRFMYWTRLPAAITPNGWMMLARTTSWFYVEGGQLQLCNSTLHDITLQNWYDCDESQILPAFENKDWELSLDATSVTIRTGKRLPILLVKVFTGIDANESDSSTEDTTIISKEDTNNESIK